MESWMPFFVMVVALAVVLQTVILAAMFFAFKRTAQRVEQTMDDVRNRALPVLAGVQVMVEEVRPQLASVVSNAAEVTSLARSQAQKMDRVMSEALERVRMQLAHVDQILTGTLETVEDAGTKFKRSVWAPVQSVAAIVRGIQTGLEFYRGRRRPFDGAGDREHQDEDLFI
jgi:uncharacterized protein YlxW (UPF0749 family)